MIEVTNEVMQEIEDNISEGVVEYFSDNCIFNTEEIADALVVAMEQLGYDEVSEILDDLDGELLSTDSESILVETPIMDTLAQAIKEY